MISFYPDKNTLKEVMATKMTPPIVRNLCRSNGIFLFSQSQEDLLETASLIFWGYDEIDMLSKTIDDSKNYKKSIRYQFEPGQNVDILTSFLDLINEKRRMQHDDDSVYIEEVKNVQIDGQKPDQQAKEITIKHIKNQPGRVRLLEKLEHTFTILAVPGDKGSLSVDIVHNDTSDLKAAKVLLGQLFLDEKQVGAKQVLLSSLTTKNKVALFDRYFQLDHSDWMREEIKSITVERDNESDDDEENIEENLLAGINLALLRGTGLRTNSFVQKCLDQGYYFTQSSIKYSHRREAIKIVIDISFKDKDRYAEISIANSYEVDNNMEYRKVFPIDEQTTYLRYYHSMLYNIYSCLIDEQKKASEGNINNGNLKVEK